MPSANNIEVYYNAFRDISKIVHSSTQLEEVLELVVWKASAVLNAKGANLRILNQKSGRLELNAVYGLSQEYLAQSRIAEKGLTMALYRDQKVVIIEDIAGDPRVQYPAEALKEGIVLMVDLPLRFRHGIVGIMRIFYTRRRCFSKEELDFMVSLAEQCICAIDKAHFIEAQHNKYTELAMRTEKLSAMGRLAAGVAHEINNPLAAILLYTSNLYKKAPEDGIFKEGLSVIMRETKRCKNIIQDLLEFSRVKEPNKVMADINTIVQRSAGILENEFLLRHIRVEQQLSNGIGDTLLDENQMEQVFVNLLLNAAHAVGEKGTIRIRSDLDANARQVVVHVEDNGPGIPPENMSRIFDPFFSTKNGGSGLGLAVSYGIVQNHHGDLNVVNLPDSGCRFTITLPRVDQEMQKS